LSFGGLLLMNGSVVARLHGAAYLLGGLWPLLHLRSFEAVFGPKTDRWLVKTVSGMLVVDGMTLLAAGRSRAALLQARRVGIGTAAVLSAIDLVYVPIGRIRPTYLLDAAAEIGLIMLWSKAALPE
jgi:hypothetical protein